MLSTLLAVPSCFNSFGTVSSLHIFTLVFYKCGQDLAFARGARAAAHCNHVLLRMRHTHICINTVKLRHNKDMTKTEGKLTLKVTFLISVC